MGDTLVDPEEIEVPEEFLLPEIPISAGDENPSIKVPVPSIEEVPVPFVEIVPPEVHREILILSRQVYERWKAAGSIREVQTMTPDQILIPEAEKLVLLLEEKLEGRSLATSSGRDKVIVSREGLDSGMGKTIPNLQVELGPREVFLSLLEKLRFQNPEATIVSPLGEKVWFPKGHLTLSPEERNFAIPAILRNVSVGKTSDLNAMIPLVDMMSFVDVGDKNLSSVGEVHVVRSVLDFCPLGVNAIQKYRSSRGPPPIDLFGVSLFLLETLGRTKTTNGSISSLSIVPTWSLERQVRTDGKIKRFFSDSSRGDPAGASSPTTPIFTLGGVVFSFDVSEGFPVLTDWKRGSMFSGCFLIGESENPGSEISGFVPGYDLVALVGLFVRTFPEETFFQRVASWILGLDIHTTPDRIRTVLNDQFVSPKATSLRNVEQDDGNDGSISSPDDLIPDISRVGVWGHKTPKDLLLSNLFFHARITPENRPRGRLVVWSKL